MMFLLGVAVGIMLSGMIVIWAEWMTRNDNKPPLPGRL